MPGLASTKVAYILSPDAWHNRGRSRAPRMPRRSGSKAEAGQKCHTYRSSEAFPWDIAKCAAWYCVESSLRHELRFRHRLVYKLARRSLHDFLFYLRTFSLIIVDREAQLGSELSLRTSFRRIPPVWPQQKAEKVPVPPSGARLSLWMALRENHIFPAEDPQWYALRHS